jgi:hypothetical protein
METENLQNKQDIESEFPPQPQQFEQPKKVNFKLWTLIIFIFILLAGYLTLASFKSWWPMTFISSKPAVSTGWKIFRHATWNFDINYPASWQVDGSGYEISNIARGQEGKDFAVVVFVKKFCQPEEATDSFKETTPKTEKSEAVFSKIVCNQGIAMNLAVSAKSENRAAYEETLEQIANSLKISVAPNSWQAYRDDAYGFEINYPTDFRITVKSDESGFRDYIFESNDISFQSETGWGETGYVITTHIDLQYSNTQDFLEKYSKWQNGNITKINGIDAVFVPGKAYESCGKYVLYNKDENGKGIYERSIRYEITDPNCFDVIADNRIMQVHNSFKLLQIIAPQQGYIQHSADNTQSVASNLFTYLSKPGDKIGGMVLSKISHPSNPAKQATPDYVYAEFTGVISVIGKLSAPTGNPEDEGMGPEYSLNYLTQDSLKKLPYLQSDTREVWFGVKNADVMKKFSVKSGDLVEMTIDKYEYVFFPAGGWNQADVVAVKKIW